MHATRFRIVVTAWLLVCGAGTALAATAPHLESRIVVDGFTGDFLGDEAVFATHGDGSPQEAGDDSRWGSGGAPRNRSTEPRAA